LNFASLKQLIKSKNLVEEPHLRDFSEEELNGRNQGLKEVKEILCSLNIKFLLGGGVLLGAIRDKDFIKWDWDVELELYTEEVIDKVDIIKDNFSANNFEVKVVDVSYENFKINVIKYNSKYTLEGLHKKGKYRVRKTFKYPAKYFVNTKKILFRGEFYMAPYPPEEFLAFTYGDWRTPIKSSNKREYLSSSVFRDSWPTKIKYFLENVVFHLRTKFR